VLYIQLTNKEPRTQFKCPECNEEVTASTGFMLHHIKQTIHIQLFTDKCWINEMCVYVCNSEDHLTLNWKSRTRKICNVTTVIHHHHRLYSPGWALASSGKCCQQLLCWAAASRFLQSSFLAPSSTPSINLDFGRLRPRRPPGFVQNKFFM
jgi:hypothetical protein